MTARTYQDHWFKRIQELRDTDPAVRKIMAGEKLTENEWEELAQKLNSPEFWFDEPRCAKPSSSRPARCPISSAPRWGCIHCRRASSALKTLSTPGWRNIPQHQSRSGPAARLLRNVVVAAVSETKYVPLDPSIFTRPPFTYQADAPAPKPFRPRRLAAIMEELNHSFGPHDDARPSRDSILYQVFNCEPLEFSTAFQFANALPTASRRYSRLQACATNYTTSFHG